LNRLGDFWPVAASFAETIPANDRLRAIAAIDALPATSLLEGLKETVGDAGARRVLMIRVRLARGEDDLAVSLFEAALDSARNPESLTFRPIAALGREEPSSEGEADVEERRGRAGEGDEETSDRPNSGVSLLRALRASFLSARKGPLIQPLVVAWLDERIQSEPAVLDYWGMRLEIGNAAERLDVGERLFRAYRRGDIAADQHADLVTLLVRDSKELAAPWIERANSSWSSFSEVERHAGWLRAVGLTREAALYMAEARAKSLFQRAEEIRAFDFWRRNIDAGGRGPEAWQPALRFWRETPDRIGEPLQARLREHSFDVLSARATLRRPTAVSPQLALLAARALRDVEDLYDLDVSSDQSLLRLRAVRSLLDRPRAARAMGGSLPPEPVASDLTRRRFRTADVDAALADLARLAAANRDGPALRSALDLLADREWAGARALRTELAAAQVEPPMVSHRVVGGRSLLYRPRDLTFGLVSQIVEADLSRRARTSPPPQPPGPR
jgi:hypothetical protein